MNKLRQLHYMRMIHRFFAVAVFACLGLGSAHAVEIVLTRVPEGGLQPQALAGADGVTHLVYFKGEPTAGNLFYARRAAGAAAFTQPIQINAQPSSAIAIGSIRGAQLALGKGGRVHVAWNGSGRATGHKGEPMFYTRLRDDGTGFEPERDVMTRTGGLDGGGSVAADGTGNVYVAWHGNTPETEGTEAARAVFLAVSTDGGRTFAPEQKVNPDPTGACGCCGLKAFANPRGDLFLLYRAARGGTERDEVLLVSTNRGQSFRSLYTHPWTATFCPMSSDWLGPAPADRTTAAWETKGRVWFSTVDPGAGRAREPVTPPHGGTGQKHPVAVSNAKGETLLVWAEGTGWQKGGAVAWQLYDSQGKATETTGRQDGIPVWSFPAVLVRGNETFEIIY